MFPGSNEQQPVDVIPFIEPDTDADYQYVQKRRTVQNPDGETVDSTRQSVD